MAAPKAAAQDYLLRRISAREIRQLMWDALRGAYELGQDLRFDNPTSPKETEGRDDDRVSRSDLRGTDLVIEALRQRPELSFIGVHSEERGIIPGKSIPGLGGATLSWTVDIWNGTKLLDNFGLLEFIDGAISLVLINEGSYQVLAAASITLNNGDIFGVDAWYQGVYLLTKQNRFVQLPGPPVRKGLADGNWLCRDNARLYAGVTGAILNTPADGGLARRTPTLPGSITHAVSLIAHGWAIALVLAPRKDRTKIWDHAPLVAIMFAMGMIAVQVRADGLVVLGGVEALVLKPPERTEPVIWVPADLVGELQQFALNWASRQGARLVDEASGGSAD
jgi:hypothetical protein